MAPEGVRKQGGIINRRLILAKPTIVASFADKVIDHIPVHAFDLDESHPDNPCSATHWH